MIVDAHWRLARFPTRPQRLGWVSARVVGPQQSVYLDPKGSGQPFEHVYGGVHGGPLNPRQVWGRHPGIDGKLLLRQPARGAQVANIPSEAGSSFHPFQARGRARLIHDVYAMHYELALGRIDLAQRESNVIDRGAQAQWDKCPDFSWLNVQVYRVAKAISRSSPMKPRRVALVSRLLAVFSSALAVCACTPDLSCSGADVQAGLQHALDDLYAQSRTLSQVDLTIKDIVSVIKSERRIDCKAVVHLDIDYFGIKKTADPIIPYTAERTDNGQVLVTLNP